MCLHLFIMQKRKHGVVRVVNFEMRWSNISLKGAVDRDKSVLGICRGIQFMSLSWAFNGIRNFLMRQMKTAER